jgi:hypothetical protein
MRLRPFLNDRSLAAAASFCAVLLGAMCISLPAKAQSGSPAAIGSTSADPGPNAVAAANRAFEEAWAKSDRATVDRALEPDFTWIDPAGILLNREEVLGNWPQPAASSDGGEVTERIYGRVALLQIHAHKAHVLRVFVDEGKHGWHLLHIIETVQAPPLDEYPQPNETIAVVPSETGVETECINPCRTVPFLPSTSNGRAALAAWQQMEIGAAAQDMKAWGLRVADEAVIVDSAGGAITKADRITGTKEHQGDAASSNEAPPLVGAHMVDLGDVVLMIAEQQPYDGQPFRATYVMVNRDGRFQMAVSYHSTIRDVPSFMLSDQLDPPGGR